MADERPDFQRRQYEFAAHIRDPVSNPAPADIEERRLAVYRELFFNNISNLLGATFRVTRRILEGPRWDTLVRDFIARHRSLTPYFLELPKEFLEFLEHERDDGEDPPYLRALAHYEWVGLALSIADEDPDLGDVDREGDLLAGTPVLSPLAQLCGYHFPVHRIGENFQPDAPDEQPTWLVVYRRLDDRLGFLELNAATARLFELVRDNVERRSGRELLHALAAEIGHADPEAVVTGGRGTLEEMRRLDIVLGTRRR
ncbi:MAG: putative DNA-binding domain-containing protein [Gammaproteobacteria bacterium]